MSCAVAYCTLLLCVTRLFHHHPQKILNDMIKLTSVCEGLDVICQVNVHTLCILHFLEDDTNEPHGHKVVPVAGGKSTGRNIHNYSTLKSCSQPI